MAIDQQPPQYPGQYPGQYPSPYPQPYPSYGAPGHPYPYVVPTSGAAVASLVCSLLGIVSFGLIAVAGVICGHIALGETRAGHRGGHGMAIAGLIIGWIQVGLWLLFFLFLVVGSVL